MYPLLMHEDLPLAAFALSHARLASTESTPAEVSALPNVIRTHGRPPAQECRLRLKRPAPSLGKPRGTLHLNPRPVFGELAALALAASFRGSLCFASLSAEKYVSTYFSVRKRTSK